MNMTRRHYSMAAHIALLVMEVIAFISGIKEGGLSILQYYTQDFNLLMLGVSIFYLCSVFHNRQSRLLQLLRLVSAGALTLTFLVVLLVLAPVMGPHGYSIAFLHGNLLFLHLLCPVLSLVSYLFWEEHSLLGKEDLGLSLIPTGLYAVILVGLNLTSTVDGPYPFLRVYHQPVYVNILWFFLIMGGALLINLILWRQKDHKWRR